MKNVSNAKMMNLFNEMISLKVNEKSEEIFTENNMMTGDTVDRVTHERSENLESRLSERNILFLKKVEAAKNKLLDGSFGTCEDCNCKISEKRLIARPTANFCIGCQEAKESIERHNINHRRDLTTENNKESDTHWNNESIAMKNTLNKVSAIGFESVVDL